MKKQGENVDENIKNEIVNDDGIDFGKIDFMK
jgi:hypothetical protein